MTQSFRSKLRFCALGLFLPGTGFNCFYLQGMKSFWARPDEKWDAQFNTEAKDNQKTESGWPVVISVILSLILGAGVMMIFLAIGFEQFFMYQIEEARKISQ